MCGLGDFTAEDFLKRICDINVSKGHIDCFGFRIAYGRRTDALAILVKSVLPHC